MGILAGDAIFVLGIVLWLSIKLGPWYVGVGLVLVTWILNKLHTRLKNERRADEVVIMAKKLNIPVPPDLQKQIDLVKNTPWWKIWKKGY